MAAASDIAASVEATQRQRLAEHLEKLEDEDAAELATEILLMVLNGDIPVGELLEALDASESFATSQCSGELTDEQASQLIAQMAVRHVTGVAG